MTHLTIVKLSMPDLVDDLRKALAARLAAVAGDRLRPSTARLIEAYRSGTTPATAILADADDVAAYAAVRMPATFAAAYAALCALRQAVPGFSPVSQLDAGGGTGAAAWAAAATFPDLRDITIIDQVGEALAFGRLLAADAESDALRGARWVPVRLEDAGSLPEADLVTVSYLLGELSQSRQDDLLDRVVPVAGAVVLIEPGTPAGYQRVIRARTRLIERGATIVAPCPHQATCPLGTGDWCHFGARVNRSALHRRLKDGEASYEDEKFCYLAAFTAPQPGTGYQRVLRRPVQRKGLVSLRLCRPDGSAGEEIVTKRHGMAYRAARDVAWGDAWHP